MSKINVREKIAQLAAQASFMTVRNMQGDSIDMGAPLKAMLSAMDDAKAVENTIKLVNEAEVKGDKEKMHQLNALRTEQWRNMVYPDANRVSMFTEVVVLGDNETPSFVNETGNEITISSLGEALEGGLVRYDPRKNQGFTLIPLAVITTPEMVFKLRDIYRGNNIAQLAEETLSLSTDITAQKEKAVDAFLTASVADGGAFGTFDLTGATYSRIYVPHSFVKTNNFPLTNVIELATNRKNTFFRPECLEAIMNYADSFGAAFNGQRLVPTGRILIPSSHASHMSKVVNVESAQDNALSRELLQAGWRRFHFAGIDWTLIPDNTLDPDAWACYPEFNIRPITFFTKPSQSVDETRIDYETRKRNEKRRYAQEVIGAYLNAAKRHAMLKVVYRNLK